MTYEIAKRKRTAMSIALAGTSGSGKTYTALLMAAGIAGSDGKVGFIDTEMGRGSMYADDAEIIAAMPNGQYLIKEITEPFSPNKYIEAIREAIKAGVTVLVIDSISHEWEGFGGCCDIAENNKLAGNPNWALAKSQHKRLMNICTQSPIDMIFCLRAREKVKLAKNDKGKLEYVPIGLQPIQEANFMFEMTLSIMFEEKNAGSPSYIRKIPKEIRHLLKEGQLVTKNVGEALRKWSDAGVSIDLELRNLACEFRDTASFGSDASQGLHQRILKDDPKLLKKLWTTEFAEEIKGLAKEADRINAEQEENQEVQEQPKLTFDNA